MAQGTMCLRLCIQIQHSLKHHHVERFVPGDCSLDRTPSSVLVILGKRCPGGRERTNIKWHSKSTRIVFKYWVENITVLYL